MAKKLRSFVHLTDERGEVHSFGPDDKVPAWAAKAMGDHVWADDDEDDAEVGAVTGVEDEPVPADEKSGDARRRGTSH